METGDGEYPLSSTMRAEKYQVFSDDRENCKTWRMTSLTLWWTSTRTDEVEMVLEVGSTGKSWEMSFVEEFDLLEYQFRRNGKDLQGTERMRKKGWAAGGGIHTCIERNVSL